MYSPKFFNLPYGLAIQIFRVGDLRRVSKKPQN